MMCKFQLRFVTTLQYTLKRPLSFVCKQAAHLARILDAEYVGHSVDQVLLGRLLGAPLVCEHHAGGHGVGLGQQRAQRLHAGRDALRDRAPHFRVVAAHRLHDQTDLA